MKRMKEVNSTEFQNKFGDFQDLAARGSPITITRHKRPSFVFLSFDDFQRLTGASRRALHPSQISKDDLAAIAKAEVPEEYAHLDDLLK